MVLFSLETLSSTELLMDFSIGVSLDVTVFSVVFLDALFMAVTGWLVSATSSGGENADTAPNTNTVPSNESLPLLSLGNLFIKIRLIGGSNKTLPSIKINPIKKPSAIIAAKPVMRNITPKNHARADNIFDFKLSLDIFLLYEL